MSVFIPILFIINIIQFIYFKKQLDELREKSTKIVETKTNTTETKITRSFFSILYGKL